MFQKMRLTSSDSSQITLVRIEHCEGDVTSTIEELLGASVVVLGCDAKDGPQTAHTTPSNPVSYRSYIFFRYAT